MPRQKKVFPFMAWRFVAGGLSVLAVLASMGVLLTKGLDYGLDFTGGTLVEVIYSEEQPLDVIRASLQEAGYEDPIVVHFGAETDVLIRLAHGYQDGLGEAIVQVLQERFTGDVLLRRVEFVGPQVGEELKEQGGLALLLALGLVMLYVSVRFQFIFSLAAVLALIHDVIVVLGVFSLFQWRVDLTVLAAILALIGYSINDTIVVADRIRENIRKIRKADIISIIDISLSETLGRTIVTSLTTLLVLVALFLFGGALLQGFSIALMIGVIVGTYSSVYVVPDLLLLCKLDKKHLLLPEQVNGVVDDLP